jgi:hypothetical protein
MATTTTDDMTQALPEAQKRQQPAPRDAYSYQLLLRFGLLNIAAFALLAAAWGNGLVAQAFASDTTRLVIVIAAVFVAGLAVASWRVYETSREINRARSFDPGEPSVAAAYVRRVAGKDSQSRQILASSLRLKLGQRITLVRHIGNSLVFLGLIGTVIGFIIALSGVDPDTVGNVENVSPMVAALIQGMSTALMTTLVGAVLNIWLMANYQLLATGTVKLYTAVIELGEDRAGT